MYKIIGADGKEYGPVGAEQLRQWLIEGRVNAQTRILPDGATEWKTLGEFPEFTAPPGSQQLAQPIRPLTAPSASYPSQRTNGFAVTGLILGVVSLVFSFCCCAGLPLNLMGIVFSAMGLAQITKRPDLYSGKGVAIAGLAISTVSLLLGVGVMILGAAFNWNEIARDLEKL